MRAQHCAVAAAFAVMLPSVVFIWRLNASSGNDLVNKVQQQTRDLWRATQDMLPNSQGRSAPSPSTLLAPTAAPSAAPAPAGLPAAKPAPAPARREILEWHLASLCNDERSQNCDDACKAAGGRCDSDALSTLRTQGLVEKAVEAAGLACDDFQAVDVPDSSWDGPHVQKSYCTYSKSPDWRASCFTSPTCGWSRICACRKAAKGSPQSALPKHLSGGAVWPPNSASSYPWDKAIGKLYEVPARKSGLSETIYTHPFPSDRPACGEPCVAHCLAGQPRGLPSVKGMQKAVRHRLFESMSPNAVVFGALSASSMYGTRSAEGYTAAFIREDTGGASNNALLPMLTFLQVHRALILREKCTTSKCLANDGAGFACNGTDLGMTKLINPQGISHNVCDIQVRRFQTCMHLVREYEKDRGVAFDFVTRQRPDMYWNTQAPNLAEHPDMLRKDRFYFTGWAACGYGGADWFYVAPREMADVVARFPDEMTCGHLKRDKILPEPCRNCLGCECMLAAWILSNDIVFDRVPAGPGLFNCFPLKFCGHECPRDWEVNPESIRKR